MSVDLTGDERATLRQAFLGDGRGGVAFALAAGRTERVAAAVEEIVAARIQATADEAARFYCDFEDRIANDLSEQELDAISAHVFVRLGCLRPWEVTEAELGLSVAFNELMAARLRRCARSK